MSRESTQNDHFSPTKVKIGLLLVLLFSGMVVFYSVSWLYHKVLDHLGAEIAEVMIAFLMVLIVILILFGFWAGFRTDRILHGRKIKALWIYRSLKRFRLMQSLWRYVEPNRQVKDIKLAAIEPISIIEHGPRRGRRPTHPLDRWMRVVQAWENRDTRRNTMTLSEYLAEQFGTYPDGSPQMSENSYYEWRKRVFKELRRLESGG